jgi:hypothetical protein
MNATKSARYILRLAALVIGLALVPHAFAGATNSAAPNLREHSFSVETTNLQAALDLRQAGWTYIMPQPKSPQAAWGNHDGRTTWYVGYWTNAVTHSSSAKQPKKDDKGQLVGDGNGTPAWRNGGSPAAPTKIEWLCSKSGGIPPQ